MPFLAVGGCLAIPWTAYLRPMLIAPSAVSVFRDAPHGSPRNELPASVAAIEDRWPVQRVLLDVAGQRIAADLTPSAVRDLELAPGHHVVAVVKATQVSLHPGGHCAP